MKLSKIILAVVLMVILALSFTSCGKKEGEEFYGKWRIEIDATAQMTEDLDDLVGDMEEYFNFDPVKLTATVTIEKDGTYTAKIDEASYDKAVDELIDQMMAGITEYYEDIIAIYNSGWTAEDMIKLSEQGMGYTYEKMFENAFDNEKEDDLEIKRGKWEVKDDKFYFTDSLDDVIENDDYALFSVAEDGSITLLEGFGDAKDDDSFTFGRYPVVLEKAQ